MRRTLIMVSLLAVSFVSSAGDTSDELETRAAASRVTTGDFMQTLKGALQQAIKDGGPLNAIAVCNEKAPGIAAELSARKGWRVGRTSLKVRNPANAPDDWERNVLKSFEQRLGWGEKPETLEHYEAVERDGKRFFRFMKAIPTGEVCLTCHGEPIDAGVAAKLKELYPEDQATGYQPGSIRGAFTVTQPM